MSAASGGSRAFDEFGLVVVSFVVFAFFREPRVVMRVGSGGEIMGAGRGSGDGDLGRGGSSCALGDIDCVRSLSCSLI